MGFQFQVLLLHIVLSQVGISFAFGINIRWLGVQMLLLHVIPHLAVVSATGGTECTQAQMVSILERCSRDYHCHLPTIIIDHTI